MSENIKSQNWSTQAVGIAMLIRDKIGNTEKIHSIEDIFRGGFNSKLFKTLLHLLLELDQTPLWPLEIK